VEGSVPSKRKEEATHRVAARDVGAPATLGSFVHTKQEKDLYCLHPVVCHDVVDGSISGPTDTLCGNRLGQAVLRR
jgi:hypothetical protein